MEKNIQNSEYSIDLLKKINPVNYYLKALNDLERDDNIFINTGRDRIGGTAFSSGIFLEKRDNSLWIGKSELELK